MSLPVCLFSCVAVICITCLILQIIEHYPQWCEYYEYKSKAREYERTKDDYAKEIKALANTIDKFKVFSSKNCNNSFELMNLVYYINKIINTTKSSTEAISKIKEQINTFQL